MQFLHMSFITNLKIKLMGPIIGRAPVIGTSKAKLFPYEEVHVQLTWCRNIFH